MVAQVGNSGCKYLGGEEGRGAGSRVNRKEEVCKLESVKHLGEKEFGNSGILIFLEKIFPCQDCSGGSIVQMNTRLCAHFVGSPDC